MKTIKGNLLELASNGEFDVVVHGCNCFHTMGAGIALGIKEIFPEAYEADKQTAYGNKHKLGEISCARIKRDDLDFYVVNAYTQFGFGKGLQVSYEAVEKAMKAIKTTFKGKSIGLPMIGAGLAGGDWNVISEIIDRELSGEDVTLVVFQP